jgi:hypothetical protein
LRGSEYGNFDWGASTVLKPVLAVLINAILPPLQTTTLEPTTYI